jgi:hypothetical protein
MQIKMQEKNFDERCSTATSGVFSEDSDASDDIESEIYTIRKVSKLVFLNHQIQMEKSVTKKSNPILETVPSKDNQRILPPIPPPKPVRLYLNL